MENVLKMQIKRTISITQKEKSDIFGFGDALSRTNPVYWRQNKKIGITYIQMRRYH